MWEDRVVSVGLKGRNGRRCAIYLSLALRRRKIFWKKDDDKRTHFYEKIGQCFMTVFYLNSGLCGSCSRF